MFRQDVEALMTTEDQNDNKIINNMEVVELPKQAERYPEVDPREQEIIVITRERTARYRQKERIFSPYPNRNQIITKSDRHCP